MIVIHYPTAFKALDSFIDFYNSKVERIKDKLRTGAVMTAKEIIRIYGVALLKSNSCQEIIAENLPALQTNNVQLSKLVKCSARSVQRHIHKLQAAGIILNKKFRGSNASYELFINPLVLLVKQKLNVDKLKNELNQVLTKDKGNNLKTGNAAILKTNCLHTYTGNNSYNKNNIIIGVDKSAKSNQLSTGNITGNTGEIALTKIPGQIFAPENPAQETGEIASRAEISGHKNLAPDAARDNSLTLYVGLFWLMARNLLYSAVDLTDRQVLIAKKLIRKLYEPASTENLFRVHQHYIARIALVSKYIARDPDHRYVTLPYLYFNTNNPKGFVGTKKWYLDDMARKKEIERELILGRIIRKYQNNLKHTAKQKPTLQVYRECENTLGKFKDPQLMQRFYASVLNHDTYKQISKSIH